MDIFQSTRRDGSSMVKRTNAPSIMFKRSNASIARRYSNKNTGVQFSKKKVYHPYLKRKIDYSEVTKNAKPNAFTPSFRRGDSENVEISSYKLLKKDCTSCSKKEM